MLNPIKTPLQMLYEQAGVPHLAGGGKGDVLTQFATSIQKAIRDYTRATGKAPTPQEVKQLEDYVISLSKPTGSRPQTMARTAAQEPFANKLVDEFGRPYSPMVDPKTGQLTTPERAKGFAVSNQFEVNPQTRAARKGLYDKAYTDVARPDEFVQVANVGRTSNRTNLRSTTPSTEELVAMQHNAENAVDDLGGGFAANNPADQTYGLKEGPTSPSQVFADMSGAIEHGALLEGKQGDLREQLVMALNPQTGERVSRPLQMEIERARQSFRARGIEPDQEDIINAVLADRNAAQHNYLGYNPIGERPMNDPTSGKVSQEYLDWQEKMRAAGLDERTWGGNPAQWRKQHKENYLLDTTPETRQSFAADWNLEDLADKRKGVTNKAAGGFIPSPRDMRAHLLVNGYDRGGRTQQPTPEQMQRLMANSRMAMEPVEKAYLERYEEIQPQAQEYKPSPSERLAATGQDFLERVGIRRPIARRASQTAFGGTSSALPGGFGLADVAAMTTAPGALAYGPISAANIGHNIGKEDYLGAGVESLNLLPFGGMAKRALTGR
jgi:hypothetical protein